MNIYHINAISSPLNILELKTCESETQYPIIYMNKSRNELIDICKEYNIKKYSGKNKADLIKLIILNKQNINNTNNTNNTSNASNTNNTCITKPSITIYKPNNQQFAVQGAVSSSARIDRLKYNTITTNGGSFYNAWGAAGANAGRYQGTSVSPYFLKNKFNKCESAQYHMNGNKRICQPQPFN